MAAGPLRLLCSPWSSALAPCEKNNAAGHTIGRCSRSPGQHRDPCGCDWRTSIAAATPSPRSTASGCLSNAGLLPRSLQRAILTRHLAPFAAGGAGAVKPSRLKHCTAWDGYFALRMPRCALQLKPLCDVAGSEEYWPQMHADARRCTQIGRAVRSICVHLRASAAKSLICHQPARTSVGLTIDITIFLQRVLQRLGSRAGSPHWRDGYATLATQMNATAIVTRR